MEKTIPAALMLFGCGVVSNLAWQAGLYANAVLAVLFGLSLASALLSRRARASPHVIPAGSSPGGSMALEIECRRLQAMLDQAPIPLVTMNVDGEMGAANRAARTLFASDHRIVEPPVELRAAIDRLRPGERTVLKLPDPAKAGQAALNGERSYALSVALGTSAAGEAVRLAVLTDIQAELQATEAATLRDLLEVLSHEIMNSLTPVMSLAESAHAMLAPSHADDAGSVPPGVIGMASEALETIMRRARGLDRFVRGYRMLAHVPTPELRPARLSVLLDEAANLFRVRWKTEGVVLTFDPPDPDIIVRMDTDLLAQALLNLLGNAAEAALAGRVRPAAVALSGFAWGDAAAVRVVDSGLGIPPGQQETIFRFFFTLKPEGTGVGLSLARQIAQSHGGNLQLEAPSPNRGASFLLTI